MKRILFLLSFIALAVLTASTAIAQVVEQTIPVVTNEAFFKLLIESIGGAKGATGLVIAGIVVKLILSFFSTEMAGQIFKKLSGGVKLTIVLFLSLASGVIALMISGVPLMTALLHSSTLSAFVVLSNQVYKQYFEKKAA